MWLQCEVAHTAGEEVRLSSGRGSAIALMAWSLPRNHLFEKVLPMLSFVNVLRVEMVLCLVVGSALCSAPAYGQAPAHPPMMAPETKMMKENMMGMKKEMMGGEMMMAAEKMMPADAEMANMMAREMIIQSMLADQEMMMSMQKATMTPMAQTPEMKMMTDNIMAAKKKMMTDKAAMTSMLSEMMLRLTAKQKLQSMGMLPSESMMMAPEGKMMKEDKAMMKDKK